MLMNVDELREIKSVYTKQGGQNGHISELTLWQAYFLLYAAWRQVQLLGTFDLPDLWLTEICTTDAVLPGAAFGLSRYLTVQGTANPAGCKVIGLTVVGKAFLKQNISALSNAIKSFGLTATQINLL